MQIVSNAKSVIAYFAIWTFCIYLYAIQFERPWTRGGEQVGQGVWGQKSKFLIGAL